MKPKFSLEVSSLIVTTSAYEKKDETFKKIRETNGGQIKEQDATLT